MQKSWHTSGGEAVGRGKMRTQVLQENWDTSVGEPVVRGKMSFAFGVPQRRSLTRVVLALCGRMATQQMR